MDRWRDLGMLLAVNQRAIELGRDLGVKCNDHERGILEFCQKQKQNLGGMLKLCVESQSDQILTNKQIIKFKSNLSSLSFFLIFSTAKGR